MPAHSNTGSLASRAADSSASALSEKSSAEAAWKLQVAADLAEAMSEAGLDGERDPIPLTLGALQEQLRHIRTLVRPLVHTRIMSRFREAQKAYGSNRHPEMALAFAELYRLLIREIPSDRRITPLRVSLLAYVSMKLVAFARHQTPNWVAIHGAIGEASIYTIQLSQDRLVTDEADRSLSRVLALLLTAMRERNADGVGQAARRLHVAALRLAGEARHT
jgi:hypothetical protein